MKLKLSKYIHFSRDEDIMPDSFYLYATRSGAALEIDTKHYETIAAGNWQEIPDHIAEALIRIEALVPEEEDELDAILALNKENVKDSDSRFLSFTIQPTANCQLGCWYCGQHHEKKVSSTETNDAIYNRIISKAENMKGQLRGLSISWYGGEPLTGLSSVEELSAKLINYCTENNINYDATMVTNALALKPKTFNRLVEEYKITRFQVTIDGTAEFHDKRRMLKNGNASFDIIFNNVKEIVHSEFFKTHKPSMLIRCNVDGENKENVMDLVDMLHEHDMLDKIDFNLAPIHDWGDNGASKINGVTKDEFASFEIDVMLKIHNYGLLPRRGLIPLRKHNVCMVVSSNSEVYDAYGNVSTCWEVPYTPVYENTEYYAGNLMKDPNLDSSKVNMRNWYNEIPTNDSWCKSCKFLPVCGGSCPKHWNRGTPACPSFKYNIDERLFLSKLLSIEEIAPKEETAVTQ